MMMRNAYWAALNSERSLKMIEALGEEAPKSMTHVDHCYDYIRQAIMCAGDMSIEGAAVLETEKERPHIDGYGTSHECNSFVSSI
jgi:hypothetical protein